MGTSGLNVTTFVVPCIFILSPRVLKVRTSTNDVVLAAYATLVNVTKISTTVVKCLTTGAGVFRELLLLTNNLVLVSPHLVASTTNVNVLTFILFVRFLEEGGTSKWFPAIRSLRTGAHDVCYKFLYALFGEGEFFSRGGPFRVLVYQLHPQRPGLQLGSLGGIKGRQVIFLSFFEGRGKGTIERSFRVGERKQPLFAICVYCRFFFVTSKGVNFFCASRDRCFQPRLRTYRGFQDFASNTRPLRVVRGDRFSSTFIPFFQQSRVTRTTYQVNRRNYRREKKGVSVHPIFFPSIRVMEVLFKGDLGPFRGMHGETGGHFFLGYRFTSHFQGGSYNGSVSRMTIVSFPCVSDNTFYLLRRPCDTLK